MELRYKQLSSIKKFYLKAKRLNYRTNNNWFENNISNNNSSNNNKRDKRDTPVGYPGYGVGGPMCGGRGRGPCSGPGLTARGIGPRLLALLAGSPGPACGGCGPYDEAELGPYGFGPMGGRDMYDILGRYCCGC